MYRAVDTRVDINNIFILVNEHDFPFSRPLLWEFLPMYCGIGMGLKFVVAMDILCEPET